MLLRVERNFIEATAVAHDALREDARLTLGGYDPGTPVPESIAVRDQWNSGIGMNVIRDDDVGGTRVVHVDQQDHRYRLRARVNHVISDAYSQITLPGQQRF